MRYFRTLLISLALFTSLVFAQQVSDLPKEKHDYQSDVARLRNIVINSLYSHRDVFLRELISNANDALEKLRLTSLTDKQVLSGAEDLNITIKADKDGKRIVITDTGIGMTPEELTNNLGTLAKSGTTEFLSRAESTDTTGTGNLIGAFGLGFYSSFLVADHVYVSSVGAKSKKNPDPVQYVFSSSAEDSSFETYPDPRGNTLGRGTEITLVLKQDALEYLDPHKITDLVEKHSSFSTTFPIYLFTQRVEQVPDEEAELEEETVVAKTTTAEEATEIDEDEAVIEDVTEENETETEEVKAPKLKDVVIDEWIHMNSQPPIWTRDPKTVTDEEYELFYQATFRDNEKPLAWDHFSGDLGSGASFKAIIYIPSHLGDEYWQNPLLSNSKDVRLMVKRVFITSDLGEDALPKWASWAKVVVDAEDLPLNVSRETLQSTKFLKQLRSVILRHLILLISRLKQDEPEKFADLANVYNNVFKLGAVEDSKNSEKLAALVQFTTNHRNNTSLNDYLLTRRQGQKQIYYLADMGTPPELLAKSVFIEKLHARGYEVLLLGDPLDEIFVQNLRRWQNVYFQDVAKAGLAFGDEELYEDQEKEEEEALAEEYEPLLSWLKDQTEGIVRDVVISNRLVTSSCAIVADIGGFTANVEKMMSSSTANRNTKNDFMHEFGRKQKALEINPRSPTIQGLLRRVKQLSAEGEERDIEAEDELKEVTSVMIDGALVRSGFSVLDSHEFFNRVDRVLRRSLGVSETASADTFVKPAPPLAAERFKDPEPETQSVSTEDEDKPAEPPVEIPSYNEQVRWEVEEIDEEGNVIRTVPHDEL